MREKIAVTQADIDGADLSFFCPIELAVRRSHPKWRATRTALIDFDYDTVAALPGVAVAFIEAFDTGRAVQPFEFEIEVQG